MSVWKPLGQVFKTDNIAAWGLTHASHPVPLYLGDDRLRVYFSTRDKDNRSSLASLEMTLDGEAFRLTGLPRGPHLGPGESGFFDSDGVTLSSLVRHEDLLFGFYLGWTVLKTVPFANFIGLAISDDDGLTFRRAGTVPIVGRSQQNPITVGYPFVIRDGSGWRMWFGTHLSWKCGDLPMIHVLKEAISNDLFAWTADDRIVIDIAGTSSPEEFAISRPCVIREADHSLSMWYAARRPHYALGHASSQNGIIWERKDDTMSFLGQPEEWEDAERTYPFVFDHKGRRYMLYNGNGYGREGFGIAVEM